MRVDLLHGLSNPGNALPWRELLDRSRHRIALADELGFDGFWLGEHHFDTQGTDQSPNPVMLLSDLAARTQKIRIGIAAVILPTWHPIRLAEDIAMLDHMTDGRLDVALSRGILQAEIINFAPEADRKDDAKSKAIFAENLAVLRAAWNDDPFSWHSDRFQVPYPGTKWPEAADKYLDADGNVTGMSVIPKPAQPGGPRLFSVTDTVSGFQIAAEQDLSVITWFPTRSVLDGLNAAYHEALDARTDADPRLARNSAVLRGYLIAPTDAEARELAEAEVTENVLFIDKVPSRGRKIWLDADEDPNDPAIQATSPWDLLYDRDHILIGSPDTVAEKMIAFGRKHHVEHWLLSTFRDNDDEIVDRSMRLMAEEVLPKVRAAFA
ncbi:MAG: LLM class flavin-dependent oxidoreductase [Leucobacter sp.]|nr:LLM class flavin-dependent oxidoreductase [Leucobacter sp.]